MNLSELTMYVLFLKKKYRLGEWLLSKPSTRAGKSKKQLVSTKIKSLQNHRKIFQTIVTLIS